MLAELKPKKFSNYIMLLEDNTTPILYCGREIEGYKGIVLCYDSVDFSTVTANYKNFNNLEFATFLAQWIIGFVIRDMWKHHFPDYEEKVDKEAFLKILEPFTLKELCDIATNVDIYLNGCEDVTKFFDYKDEHTELFKKPICLLLFYLIRNNQTKLITNWQYTPEELKELLNIMNVSEDVLA